jgi:iron complex outermembrane receptor protein
VTGLQLNHSRRSADDRFLSDGDDGGLRVYNNANPKLGVLWDVDPATQVFGNLSRSAEPPTFSELNPTAAPGFADLKAQTATTLEIGTRGRHADYEWDLSLYRAWLRDELQLFQQPDGTTLALNAGKTVHQGVELGLNLSLLKGLFADGPDPDRLWLRQAYTFSDFRFDGDPQFGDDQLPGAPRHYYRAELRYSHPSGFYFGPNIEWVPESYFIDNANTARTEPYVLVGFRAGYAVTEGLSIFLDARNLANTAYIANVGVVPVATASNANVYNPGDGRAIYAGLEFRW